MIEDSKNVGIPNDCIPSTQTKYWIGNHVGSLLADDLEGIVTRVCISAGEHVTYEVAWIHDGKRETAWFDEFELRGVNNMPETIGFVRHGTGA